MHGLRLNAVWIAVVATASLLSQLPASADEIPGTPAEQQAVNTPPDTPEAADIRDSRGGTCSTDPDEPQLINTTAPTLYAKVRDRDAAGSNHGVKLSAQFEWEADGVLLGAKESITANISVWPASAERSVQVTELPELTLVGYRARGNDGHDPGEWSQWCYLEVKTSDPEEPPTVISSDYPDDNGFHGHIGLPGDFTFDGNGDPDAVHFHYDLMGEVCDTELTPSTPGGSVTTSITPRSSGPTNLYARTVDAYGNSSACEIVYTFNVAPLSDPIAHFTLDEGSGGTAADSADGDRTATGAVDWTRGRVGNRVNYVPRLNGTAVHANGIDQRLATAGPVVDTTGSFSVGAWVRLDAKGRNRAAVSQDGTERSGFHLGYHKNIDRWVFTLAATDATGSGWERSSSDEAAVRGAWTHLLGVFDAETGEVALYVNGVRQERTGSQSAPWNAEGGLVIGGATHDGQAAAPWSGAVDDVKVWDRVLFDEPIPDGLPVAETWTLANQPVALEGRWTLDETEGTVVADNSDRAFSGTLHGDPATAWNQAFNDAGTYTTGVTLTGGERITTDGPAVRTDRSFSVGGWVRPTGDGGDLTAFSQDARNHSGFTLGTRQVDGLTRWAFSMPGSARADNTTWAHAVSTSVVEEGEWMHVAATFDATTGTMTLYVDGNKQGTTVQETPWNAGGSFVMGGGQAGGEAAQSWAGDLDEVHVYQGVLDDYGITQIRYGFPA